MDHDDDGVGADVPLSPEAAPADDPAVAVAELDGVPFSPPRDVALKRLVQEPEESPIKRPRR
eukprot:5937956-Pleurochrysis_carterae.AAC.1